MASVALVADPKPNTGFVLVSLLNLKRVSLAQAPPTDKNAKWCGVPHASVAGITDLMLGEGAVFVTGAWGPDVGPSIVWRWTPTRRGTGARVFVEIAGRATARPRSPKTFTKSGKSSKLTVTRFGINCTSWVKAEVTAAFGTGICPM